MATARVTANTTKQPLFSVPLHMKGIIDAIDIDNQGAAANTIQLEDDFTQDISHSNGTPTARSSYPWQGTIPVSTLFTADELSTKRIECLGDVSALASAIDASCVIIVAYHFE